jgi:hypothetical protein
LQVGINILEQYTASIFMAEVHFLWILSTHLPDYMMSQPGIMQSISIIIKQKVERCPLWWGSQYFEYAVFFQNSVQNILQEGLT